MSPAALTPMPAFAPSAPIAAPTPKRPRHFSHARRPVLPPLQIPPPSYYQTRTAMRRVLARLESCAPVAPEVAPASHPAAPHVILDVETYQRCENIDLLETSASALAKLDTRIQSTAHSSLWMSVSLAAAFVMSYRLLV